MPLLVLSRKREQSIIIGENVRITVLSVQGDFVKLGIEAPRGIRVLREELYREVREENTLAVKVPCVSDELLQSLEAMLPGNVKK